MFIVLTVRDLKCPRCEYEWKPKIIKPKECPRCKARLDYTPGSVGAPKIGKKGGEKEMTSKLPLMTVALIIVVVAAIGAWKIFVTPTEVTPTTHGWSSASVVGFTSGQKSGIVAVYIAKTGQNYNDNWTSVATTDNYYLKQTASGQTGDIPYETDFVFLIEVVGDDDNMAYITADNLKVELSVTGSFTKAAENTDGGDGAESVFTTTASQIGVNAVWDNDGNYFKLPAAGSIDYTTKLWLWA
jgi:hypothetical protein